MTHREYKWFRQSGLLGTSQVDILAERQEDGTRHVTFFARDVFGCEVVTNLGKPMSTVSNLIKLLEVICSRDAGITFDAEPRRAKLYARQLKKAGIQFRQKQVSGNVHFKIVKK